VFLVARRLVSVFFVPALVSLRNSGTALGTCALKLQIRSNKSSHSSFSVLNSCCVSFSSDYPFKDEAQTALFKDPVRTAL